MTPGLQRAQQCAAAAGCCCIQGSTPIDSFLHFLHAAANQPIFQGLVIIGGTFVLEDVATIAAATEASSGHVGATLALVALYIGIVAGDAGLYGLGALAARFPWAKRWRPANLTHGKSWIETHVFQLVFAARFVPGARLPTYTACGFLRADVMKFLLATFLATLVWTTSLFLLSLRLGKSLLAYSVWWRWAGMACFLIVIIAIGRFCARMSKESP